MRQRRRDFTAGGGLDSVAATDADTSPPTRLYTHTLTKSAGAPVPTWCPPVPYWYLSVLVHLPVQVPVCTDPPVCPGTRLYWPRLVWSVRSLPLSLFYAVLASA